VSSCPDNYLGRPELHQGTQRWGDCCAIESKDQEVP
jgi:hypothetical protein